MTTRRLLSTGLTALAVLASIPRGALRAQPVTMLGSVSDSGGVRIAGALVVALDANGDLVARALSGRTGTFTLRLPAANTVVLHALRAGFEPSAATIVAGTARAEAIALTASMTPVRISSDKSRQRNVCGTPRDTASDVTRLWEEARKVLASTRLNFGDADVSAHIVFSDRRTSRDGKTVLEERVREGDVAARRPFVSLPPDSVANAGYVIETADDASYYAPDAEVLLSGRFGDSHCFGVQSPPAAHADWIGLSFKPKSERVGVKDISGTLWFDRSTLALRRLEYRYTNVPTAFLSTAVGGELAFARLPQGVWIISHWEVRMPQGEIQSRLALQHSQVREQHQVTVESLRVSGGTVTRVTIGDATVPVPF